MKAGSKIALLGAIMALSSVPLGQMTFQKFKTPLSQSPLNAKEVMSKMIENYVDSKMPKNLEDVSSVIVMKNSHFEGNVNTIDKVNAKKYFDLVNRGLIVKLTDEQIENYVAKIEAENPTNFIHEFGIEGLDDIRTESFNVRMQVLFVVFPQDKPESFMVSFKQVKRKGEFAPIVKEVVETVCEKKWFGFIETCRDVVKRTETPRVVDEKLKRDTQNYLTALMLKDIKENQAGILFVPKRD